MNFGALGAPIGKTRAENVAFKQAGTGAVERTAQDKMRDAYHAKDFGVLADGTTNDSTAFTAAWTAAAAAGRSLLLPPGTIILNRFTFSSHVPLIGDSRTGTTLRRLAAATTGAFINVTATAFTLMNCTVDGNKANNANGNHNIVIGSGCVESLVANVRSINAKANAGWGTGIYYDPGHTTGRHVQQNVDCADNDAHGTQLNDAYGFSNDEACTYQDNGNHGLFINNYDLTLTDKMRNIYLSPGARYLNNGDHGCVIDNFLEDNVQSPQQYGPDDPEVSDVRMGGYAAGNAGYGFALSGTRIWAAGLQATENASDNDGYAGILFNASHSVLQNPQAYANEGFGIDAGGSTYSSIINPKVWDNANDTAISRPGLNLEGCINVLVTDPDCGRNGHDADGINIQLERYGGADSTHMFDFTSKDVAVQGGLVYVDETRYGIYGKNNPENVSVDGVAFRVASSANTARCVVMLAADPKIRNCRLLDPGNLTIAPSSNTLTVPDILDFVTTNSADTINSILTGSMAVVGDGVAYLTITNPGSGYTSAPSVGFSGGGGTGAAAIALIDTDGLVRGLRMTAHGSGYSSAPTVNITGGGGSGATATATWRLGAPEGHSIAILHQQQATITRLGTPNVENSEASDIIALANSTVRMRAFGGKWYAGDYRRAITSDRLLGRDTASTGAVEEISIGAGLEFSGAGSLRLREAITADTSTSLTIQTTDRASLVTVSNSSPVAVTLPQATGSFGVGFWFEFENKGAGAATITPTTSTINGAASLTVRQNQGCRIVSDGTDWQVQRGMGESNITSINATDNALVQVLRLEGDRATPTDGDSIYQSFYLSDDTGVQTEFVRITARAIDVSNTTEDGDLTFGLLVAGTLINKLFLDNSALRPITNDGLAIGDATRGIADLFLAAGGEIRLNNVQLLDTVGGLSTQTAAAASIAAVGNAINTANKRAGKMVFDTTNTRLMVATGSAAADPWKSADGGTTVTPA